MATTKINLGGTNELNITSFKTMPVSVSAGAITLTTDDPPNATVLVNGAAVSNDWLLSVNSNTSRQFLINGV
jgi:hypothetical protein